MIQETVFLSVSTHFQNLAILHTALWIKQNMIMQIETINVH